MPDDPREILRAAGVECAELDDYLETRCIIPHKGDLAILAVARLVAKYKWQRDATVTIAGYNEEEAQELLDEVDLEWHEEERRRRDEHGV